MSERNPEDILKELEDDKNRPFDRASILWKVAHGYEKRGHGEKAQRARIEAKAFDLRTEKEQRNKSFPGYFQPWWAISEEQIAEVREFFDEKALSHLANKASTVSNPIHAARFADVAWDFAIRKDPEVAKLAIRKYMDCADLYCAIGWGPDFGAAMKRLALRAILSSKCSLLKEAKDPTPRASSGCLCTPQTPPPYPP